MGNPKCVHDYTYTWLKTPCENMKNFEWKIIIIILDNGASKF
jgi:hypothetical protein